MFRFPSASINIWATVTRSVGVLKLLASSSFEPGGTRSETCRRPHYLLGKIFLLGQLFQLTTTLDLKSIFNNKASHPPQKEIPVGSQPPVF